MKATLVSIYRAYDGTIENGLLYNDYIYNENGIRKFRTSPYRLSCCKPCKQDVKEIKSIVEAWNSKNPHDKINLD